MLQFYTTNCCLKNWCIVKSPSLWHHVTKTKHCKPHSNVGVWWASPLESIQCYRLVMILCTPHWSSHIGIVMWLVSPTQQQQLMNLAATDTSISAALPQRLLVPVLQMLHDGSEPLCSPEWPAVTANAQGLSDEFCCRFNYAAIHSATQSVSLYVQGLQFEDCASAT